MNSLQIECAVASLFGSRRNIIVPNISWGAGLHECDLLIISKSGFAIEVEIKISKSDLKADFSKKHNHISERIKNLYYAIPENLLAVAEELVPITAGIIVCKEYHTPTQSPYISALIHRSANPDHKYRKMTNEEIANISRLGCMRIWNLKYLIIGKNNDIKHLKKSIAA